MVLKCEECGFKFNTINPIFIINNQNLCSSCSGNGKRISVLQAFFDNDKLLAMFTLGWAIYWTLFLILSFVVVENSDYFLIFIACFFSFCCSRWCYNIAKRNGRNVYY